MRKRIVIKAHYTVRQHSKPFFSEWPYALFQCFAIPFLRYCGPLLHEFHHQHSFPLLERSSRQLSVRQRLFKLLRLFWWMCVCMHFLDCSMVSTFTNETQVSLPVTMRLRNSSLSLWYRSKNHSVRFVHTSEHFRNPFCVELEAA
jgi:hypothetical protein